MGGGGYLAAVDYDLVAFEIWGSNTCFCLADENKYIEVGEMLLGGGVPSGHMYINRIGLDSEGGTWVG